MATDKTKGEHGGARTGAGRKPITAGGPVPRRQVTFDDETKDLLKAIGNGNVSEGIRIAARIAAEALKIST